MATHQDFSINKGRTGTIVVTVTGVSSWTNILAKLYAVDVIGDAILMTLTGTINSSLNTITFNYVYTDTASLTQSSLYFEVVIYKADKSYIQTTTDGLLNIASVIKVDPTV